MNLRSATTIVTAPPIAARLEKSWAGKPEMGNLTLTKSFRHPSACSFALN